MIKYIFCINPGRSGSHYLSHVLEHFQGISSNHEAPPFMNGIPMMKYLKGDKAELKNLMPMKVDSIKKSLKGYKCYVETSHLFIKGFGWEITNYLPPEEIGIVVLKRDKEKVVDSFMRINCTPLSFYGKKWIMNPEMEKAVNSFTFLEKIKYKFNYLLINKVLRAKMFKLDTFEYLFFNNYKKELLKWYYEETYSQGEKFKKQFLTIKVFETTTEKLNKAAEFKKMFDFFGLEFKPDKSFFEVINQKTNLKR